MQCYFADLHIHVGMTTAGQWIKIPSSRRLTIANILEEAVYRKGLDLIGVVDAMSPPVLHDLTALIDDGRLQPLAGGGYRYQNDITLLLGAEIETSEADGSQAHTLLFLPDITAMTQLSRQMATYIHNINLSSQNAHMTLGELFDIASRHEAIVIPAHVFTPHKSLFGVCCRQLSDILTAEQIAVISAIELGLSADSSMADRMRDLGDISFLSNSDAHSLTKIAREYNLIQMAAPDFNEFRQACRRQNGRQIVGNYGLDPRLGKYHQSYCCRCETSFMPLDRQGRCPVCGSAHITKGVAARIEELAAWPATRCPAHRPPYTHQVPLEFVPGVGKQTLAKLLGCFGSEMAVLHKASVEQLAASVGPMLANTIVAARCGQAVIASGAGGIYGRLLKRP